MRIVVEDAPFLAVLMDVEGEGRGQHLVFTTNVGDTAVAGPTIRSASRPIRSRRSPRPMSMCGAGSRPRSRGAVFYRLVDLAVVEDGMLGVWSCGAFFAIGRAP